jgi:phosphoglycolate phosphatase
MPIKLILFDLDGTLVDSLADLTSATNHMRAAFGRLPLGEAEVSRFVGQGAGRLVERALPGASATELAEGLALFLSCNEAHIADRSRLYPEVQETLIRIGSMGLLQAVISNKNENLCRRLLEILGIAGYFAAVLGADSLPFRKPSPEPLLRLLDDFDVSPDEAVMVGDSVNDIAAGKGAGVATVGCTYGYGDDAELAEADYRIASLPELLGLPLFG